MHLVHTGYDYREDIRTRNPASHTEHVILLLETGRLRFEHEGEIVISPGMLVLVPAGMPHRPLEGKNIGVWWMGFCASCLALDESHSLMAPFQQVRLGALPLVNLAEDRKAHFIMLLKELKKESARLTPDTTDVVKSLLVLILNEVKKASRVEPSVCVGTPPIVSRALEFIQKHSLRSISLKDVAEAIHISPAYLATTIKKATGYTVGDWITRTRLAEACSRLLHTDEQVDSIVYQIGWHDVTHFIRQFKKVYGITPAAWRKKNKLSHIGRS